MEEQPRKLSLVPHIVQDINCVAFSIFKGDNRLALGTVTVIDESICFNFTQESGVVTTEVEITKEKK